MMMNPPSDCDDEWRETVRLIYDVCHLQQEVTPMDVVALIEQRHPAFFGAKP